MNQTWSDEPFTRGDLASLGLTELDLRRGRRRSEVRQVLHGVWVGAHVPDSTDLRVRAVGKVVRPHQVVADRTAAWLHGVDVFEHEGIVGPVELCALRDHEPAAGAGVDGRTRDLLPVDEMRTGGVRVTTPLRTAMDLGCCLRRREAFAAMNALARRHEFTRVDLERVLPRYRRRRGVIQLRQLVALVDPRIESQRESWVYLEIVDAGLEPPEPQVWIEIEGVATYRLDFAYRRQRACVEYDGDEWHSSPEQRAHDERRRQWLREHGWTVIVVCRGDFTGAARERWLGELRDALAPRYTNRRW